MGVLVPTADIGTSIVVRDMLIDSVLSSYGRSVVSVRDTVVVLGAAGGRRAQLVTTWCLLAEYSSNVAIGTISIRLIVSISGISTTIPMRLRQTTILRQRLGKVRQLLLERYTNVWSLLSWVL